MVFADPWPQPALPRRLRRLVLGLVVAIAATVSGPVDPAASAGSAASASTGVGSTESRSAQPAGATEPASVEQDPRSSVGAVIDRSASILGRVIDQTGRPLAEISVVATDVDTGERTAAVTGVNGAYRLIGLAGGRYRLRLEDLTEQYVSVDRGPISVSAGRAQGLPDIRLSRGRRLLGAVMSSHTGGPLVGAEVVVRRALDGVELRRATTGGDGRYVASGLEAVPVTVQAVDRSGLHRDRWYRDGVDRDTASEVSLARGNRTGIDLELGLDASIHGTVRDPGGVPVAGIRLVASAVTGQALDIRAIDDARLGGVRAGGATEVDGVTVGTAGFSTVTVTDSTGFYRFHRLPVGIYELHASDPELRYFDHRPDPGRLPVDGDDSIPVDVAIRPAGRIAGTVSEATEGPVGRIPVRVHDRLGDIVATATTGPDGRYLVGPLETGAYRVGFAGVDFASVYHRQARLAAEATPVDVVEGTATAGIDVVVERLGWIEGAVNDEAGAPVAGASVTLERRAEPDRPDGDRAPTATTDERGRYRIGGLEAGSYDISIGHPEGIVVPRRVTTVNVGLGRGSLGDAVLDQAGLISGVVTDNDGRPVPFTEVTAAPFDGGPMAGSAVTAFDGTYRIGGLPVGRHRVGFPAGRRHLARWFDDADMAADAEPVTVEAGTVTTGIDAVLQEGYIGGQVSDTGGAPISDLVVSLHTAGGRQVGDGTTDDDGRFRLAAPPRGEYVLHVRDPRRVHAGQWYGGAAGPAPSASEPAPPGPAVIGYRGRDIGDADVTVRRRGAVVGTVTGPDEEPAGGVRIEIDGRTATTDDDGAYRVDGVEVGVHRLSASDPLRRFIDRPPGNGVGNGNGDGDGDGDGQELTVGPERDHVVDIRLARYGSIIGTVTDGAGTPLAGIEVLVDGPVPSDATTDDAGRYRVVGLVTGDHLLRFRDPSGAHPDRWYRHAVEEAGAVPVPVELGRTTIADMQLRTDAALGGRVTDIDGKPLPGIEVDLSNGSVRTTDDDGRYRFDRLRPGPYTVRFSDPEGRHQSRYHRERTTSAEADPIVLVPGQERLALDATMRRLGRIEGRVVDRAGVPLEHIDIDIATRTEPGFGPTFAATTTGPDGSFVFDRLPPGSWVVGANDPGAIHLDRWWTAASTPDLATPIDVDLDTVIDDLVLVLEAGASLSGRVTSVDDGPRSAVPVVVLDPAGRPAATATTDADGAWTTPGLRPGRYTVRVGPDGDYGARYHGDTDRGASDRAGATVLTLAAGEHRSGIDVDHRSQIPAPVDDRAETDEDIPLDLEVLANDRGGAAIDPTTLTIEVAPTRGRTELGPDGVVRYTPRPDANGPDRFRYSICAAPVVIAVDSVATRCAEANVTVEVRPVNDEPVAEDDRTSLKDGAEIIIPVLANDRDPDGDRLTIASVSTPPRGRASATADGIRYRPARGFCGFEQFDYTVSDPSGATATASIPVFVDCDYTKPVAFDDAVETVEDRPTTIEAEQLLANDRPALGPLALVEVGPADHGEIRRQDDGSLRYLPPPDWSGVATFAYSAADPLGPTTEATVTVTVAPVNDGPTITARIGPVMAELGDEIEPVTVEAVDIDDPDLRFSLLGMPEGWTLSVGGRTCDRVGSGSRCRAAIIGNASGPAASHTIVVRAVDGAGLAAETSVEIQVRARPVTVRFADDQPLVVTATGPEGRSGPFAVSAAIAGSGDLATAAVGLTLIPDGDGSPIAASCLVGAAAGLEYAGGAPVVCAVDRVPVGSYRAVISVEGRTHTGRGSRPLIVRPSEAQAPEPQAPEPRAPEPQTTDPQAPEPQAPGPQAPEPVNPACGPVEIGFDRAELWNAPGRRSSSTTPAALDCTRYELVLTSTDANHRSGYQPGQRDERWVLEGLDGAGAVLFTSPPSEDLPDDLTTMSQSVGSFELDGVVAFRARHLGTGGINSVHAAATLRPLPVD